jgi:ElaA protein
MSDAAQPGIHWTWVRFQDLSLQGLYDALQLRAQVFILEQGPYLDPDGLDQQSWHLLGRGPEGNLLLYLRLVDPGLKYPEPSLGRVVSHAAVRGSGLGRALVRQGVERCVQTFPGLGIRISAQAHLARFYGGFGFVPCSEPYLEDNIPHLEMLRAP